jgi:protein-S-isoprenylcysteine O-methyltransferase Ste14
MQSTAMLTQAEVEDRLYLCQDNSEINSELYDFGLHLKQEMIDRVRSIESRAVTLAAYGAAIVTLLVSSSASWSKLGNWAIWIAVSAALYGTACTWFAIRAISLREQEWNSENEWLKVECLSETLDFLKQYRILILWGFIHSRDCIRAQKARELRRATVWLEAAVVSLLVLLCRVATLATVEGFGAIRGWKFSPHFGGGICVLILGLILGGTIWRSRRLS